MYHMKIYILYKSSFLIFSFSFPFHIVLECGAIFGHKYCFLTYVIFYFVADSYMCSPVPVVSPDFHMLPKCFNLMSLQKRLPYFWKTE